MLTSTCYVMCSLQEEMDERETRDARATNGGMDMDEDEDGPGGGPGVQCAQA